MNFLLDTNVVSEPLKPRPNAGVMNWLAAADEDTVFISVVTITELRYGIQRLDQGRRRQRLNDWLEGEFHDRFAGRMVPVNEDVADACGRIVAYRESTGRPIETRDAYIAATAEVYGMTLVTRNAEDFKSAVGSILTPWS